MKRRYPPVLLILGCLLLVSPAVSGQDRYEIAEEEGLQVEMRDGVKLVADLCRPKAPGPFPVLLQRTPYDRKTEMKGARELASHGYIVVVQDTRGRFQSEGVFYPFRFEKDDGYDTVEWAAGLPGSDGKVGMYGGSYVGATQMLAAIGAPPHLVAIQPRVTAAGYYDSFIYQSGAFMQWFANTWTTFLLQDTVRRDAQASARPYDWTLRLPVDAYPLVDVSSPPSLAPYYSDWIEHETDDAYWEPWKISDHYGEMAIKGLHIAGWHDIFMKGSIQNYIGMKSAAATAEARAGQRLLVGPWAHWPTLPDGKVGDIVFGPSARLDSVEGLVLWSDWALKGIRNSYDSDPPVRIFVMGDNVWRFEDEFPLQRQVLTPYYLHSDESANGLRGDGTLSTRRPEEESPEAYEYDPDLPVPTIGGRLCCGSVGALSPGPFDQRANESRDDVLVFSTPPLSSELEVTGFVRLELYASSTATDTDFTAMLVDVEPDGYSRYVTDGIVRGRYRRTASQSELLVPGTVYQFDIDLWATSNVFKKGHRIRLLVSSSNFPRFSRNLNSGEGMLGSTGTLKATQRVYHDRERASALMLPIIPRP